MRQRARGSRYGVKARAQPHKPTSPCLILYKKLLAIKKSWMSGHLIEAIGYEQGFSSALDVLAWFRASDFASLRAKYRVLSSKPPHLHCKERRAAQFHHVAQAAESACSQHLMGSELGF